MRAESSIKVVLCWHMHQPDYRDYSSGEYQLPWTYLHAIKDYVDMAAHLERYPRARVVINFAPILLEQIEDYGAQIQQYFDNNTTLRDPLLRSLAAPVINVDSAHSLSVINACLKANVVRMVERYQPFSELFEHARWVQRHPQQLSYLGHQYFADLLVWYHLAWLGETVRRENQQVQALMAKSSGFNLHDRQQLLGIIGGLLSTITDRYRALMERGQIELSISPYAHPIIPLLVDSHVAAEAMPGFASPVMDAYPGGDARAKWHIESAIEVSRRYFGKAPQGCWLSEGGISEAAVALLDEFDLSWTASGENVLRNSLCNETTQLGSDQGAVLCRSYKLKKSHLQCFFRDDELSDLIGFSYSSWHGDDAAADLISRLLAMADDSEAGEDTVVSIILDGENAWESYPNNGYFFLDALYSGLCEEPRLTLTTFADCVDKQKAIDGQINSGDGPAQLSQIVAGSWVYGTFSTWIGEAQKNRAWDMLADAKHCFDQVMAQQTLNDAQRDRATQQLASCESSDWFWWFGDTNPAATVVEFDRLFRMHLANLYLFLGREPPEYLANEHFTGSDGEPLLGGVMKPGALL